MRQRLAIGVGVVGLLALLAIGLVARTRLANCQAVPLLGAEQLPNPGLRPDPAVAGIPLGWGRGASGVELQGPQVGDGRGFDLDGDGRAVQLLGIANFLETPPLSVQPNSAYCFAGQALTDSAKGAATRVRVTFRWLNGRGDLLAEDRSAWLPVARWTPQATSWSPLLAAATAPPGATELRVRIAPAADDRVYLDAMHVRRTTGAPPVAAAVPAAAAAIAPWPDGRRAAASFSFDWETAMGGLIHSRSDDPRYQDDPLIRGLRMREGVTTTLAIFRTYGISATYYATGYNFLRGNRERQIFLGDPVFSWADHTVSGKWPNDKWVTRPWFADDPYGTEQSDPAWYFGDLVPLLRKAGQDIQSHTFSHFDGGLAPTAVWRADLRTWQEIASAAGVPAARSLAFPWSSSAGLSDADWQALADAGVTSVTRTNTRQPQFQLADRANWQCQPVPAHSTILACPDFYLTAQSAARAPAALDAAIAKGGAIDLWAHTEEVTAPDQIAAWQQVVAAAAQRRDNGALWIAPLAEIAARQQATAQVTLQSTRTGQGLRLRLSNPGAALPGLTVRLERAAVRAEGGRLLNSQTVVLNLASNTTAEVELWNQ